MGTAILPAQVELDYASLDYGGVGGSYGAQVYVDQAVVTLTHGLIRNSAGNGVYVTLQGGNSMHILPTLWITPKTPSNSISHLPA